LHWCLLRSESFLKSLEVSLTALTAEDVGVGIPEAVGVPREERLSSMLTVTGTLWQPVASNA
jgi:hypothetical protein